MSPTTPTIDLSDRDNKETLFVKEEVTDDAEAFGEVVVDVEGPQKETSNVLVSTKFYWNFLLQSPPPSPYPCHILNSYFHGISNHHQCA